MIKFLNSVLLKISKRSEKSGKTKRVTIFIDLDGTLVKHAFDHFEIIDVLDMTIEKLTEMKNSNIYLVLTTGRQAKDCKMILKFFRDHGIKFDQCIFNLPTGKRILINDNKYPGVDKAAAYTYPRNYGIRDFNDF